ncbi:MAG: lysophospholipid acyltransferase family protein [Syntrophothermus sp.]
MRFLGNRALFYILSILCRTLKINVQNGDCINQLRKENKNYILAFWHGTMLIPWFIHRDQNFAALVSKSKDGSLLYRILKKWNYKVVRGSSHTGGSVALGILVDHAKNEHSVAITPDGPRGPVLKFKAGAVVAAKKSGVPLVLLGVAYEKKRTLRSWDKFEIPKFFSRANLIYSEPYYINDNLNYDQTSEIISMCENKLNNLQKEAGGF